MGMSMNDLLELFTFIGGGDLLIFAIVAIVAIMWMRSFRRNK
jgi:hypothetical protein